MYEKIKRIFENIFGTKENLRLKLGVTFFIVSIIFLVLSYIHYENFNQDNYFSFVSALCFIIWIVIIKGVNSLQTFAYELIRILLFFYIFIISINSCIQYSIYNKESFMLPIAIIGVSFGVFYLVCKMMDIFYFIKNLFKQIKNKIFDSNVSSSTNKWISLLENSTAFLVAIGGLAIAVKTIIETIVQLLEYVKV